MKEYYVLGVKVSGVSLQECLELVSSSIKKNKKIQVCTTNNEFIVEAQHNDRFKNIINKSAISTADSTGVVWAIQKLHNAKIDRLPGIDLFLEICKEAPQKGYRIFLLGGEKNIALKAKKNLQRRFQGIHIVGSIDGIIINPSKRDDQLISTINRSRSDIVAVALGAPKQELWIKKNIDLIQSKVFLGLGGSLDYIAGTVPRAPLSMRNNGLEWLFRLFIQPQRIGRILKATLTFPYLVTIEKFKKGAKG